MTVNNRAEVTLNQQEIIKEECELHEMINGQKSKADASWGNMRPTNTHGQINILQRSGRTIPAASQL